VILFLCHGCPVQAIVADWRDRSGRHAHQFHDHHVLRGQLEWGHVQADELFVKAVAQRLWMAMAMAVPSRLWLGGVVSVRRDLTLIMTVVGMVQRAANGLRFLVCVDGLGSYVTAFVRVFRDPVRIGQRGRPRLRAIPGLLLGQVIKHHRGRHLVDVTRRVVLGTAEAMALMLSATGTGTGINTSYIERLNATFRASICPLVRRGRAIARGEGVLSGWMDLVGCSYNFCWEHDSLRVAAPMGESVRWWGRTPAMAAGLTDHRWTMRELSSLPMPMPLPAWVAPPTPRSSTEAISGSQAGPGMTTVPCGATRMLEFFLPGPTHISRAHPVFGLLFRFSLDCNSSCLETYNQQE
jgi:hypothetical protein